MAVDAQLLKDTKNYLDITWDDEAGDKKISGIIERGQNYLDGIAGEKLDYSLEELPRALLFDYAMYARSNALDEFRVNYKSELLSLQISCEVKRYVPEEETTIVQ